MNRVRQILLPSLYEALLYLTIGIAMLILGSYQQVLKYLEITDSGAASNSSMRLNPSEFSGLLQTQNWTAVASTMLFWALVGVVVSMVGWGLLNMVIDFYNTYIVSTNFKHPRHFEQRVWWADYIVRLLIKVLVGIAIILYTFLFSSYLYPFCLSRFQTFLRDTTSFGNFIAALMSVFIMVILVHVMVILFRFSRARPKVV